MRARYVGLDYLRFRRGMAEAVRKFDEARATTAAKAPVAFPRAAQGRERCPACPAGDASWGILEAFPGFR